MVASVMLQGGVVCWLGGMSALCMACTAAWIFLFFWFWFVSVSTAPCFLAGLPTHSSILPSAASVAAVPLSSASPLQPTTTLPLQSMAPVPVWGMPPSSDPAIPGVSSPVVLPSQAFGMPGNPAAPGLSLSLSAEPIPARLVQKIQSGQFVEMRELLGDNIALTQYFESSAGYFPMVLPSSARPRLREVSTLPSWIYCFLTYLAVLVQDQFIRCVR